MTKIQKFLRLFKLTASTETPISTQLSYQDIEEYNLKPFDLKYPFISDGHFTCIPLSDYNLDVAYKYLKEVNNFIMPFSKYFDNAKLPTKISTEHFNQHAFPMSHLRLTPYTKSNRKCKYPFYLWLEYYGHYGFEYLYKIYFDANGTIKKCDLNFSGNPSSRTSYRIQIRYDGHKNYVRRIDKTLYIEPYGTHTTYMHDEQ